MQTPQKINFLEDEYLHLASIHMLGMTYFSFLLFSRLGWNSLFIIIPMALYILFNFILLVIFRFFLINYHNEEIEYLLRINIQIVKTQEMLSKKERNLYKKRIMLLGKAMARQNEKISCLKKALEVLISIRPIHVNEMGSLLTRAKEISEMKIFLNKGEIDVG